MKLIVNILLFLLVLGLIYVLVTSIQEPIAFQNEYSKRKDAVVSKLIEIREAQNAYKSIKGEYAPTLDTLKEVLGKDSFKIIKLYGDDSDPNNFRKEISYVKAVDSIKNITFRTPNGKATGVNLDSLGFVPYGTPEAEFIVAADTITYQQAKGIAVVEVKVALKDFMDGYTDKKYKRYDPNFHYDDSSMPQYYVRFGDISKPSTSGNWEN